MPRRPRSPRPAGLLPGLLAGLLAVGWLAAPPPVAAAARPSRESLAAAQELVEAEQPQAALEMLDRLVARDPKDAAALLLRSTARFMLGDQPAGRRDLERSLALDPTQRQGWLNLAGLEVANERYAEALTAFEKAEALDPGAPDNDLNIGTVLLLRGDLGAATERFSRYLAGSGDDASGHYLVAKNYALAGYEALAIESLRRAIELDEKARISAKGDANFRALRDNPRYRALMETDAYRPPADAPRAAHGFPALYDGGRGPLLAAVLDTLQLAGKRFDPRVEVTEGWALVWSDEYRIKVSDAGDGRGRVELTAPAGPLTPAEWEQASGRLFQQIAARLAVIPPPREPLPPVEARPHVEPPLPGAPRR